MGLHRTARVIPLSILLVITSVWAARFTCAQIGQPPHGPDVILAGALSQSHLGGTGTVDTFTDANRSQPLAIGDFNGDGIADLAMAAPDARLIVDGSTRTGAGVVYVVFGRKEFPGVIDTAAGVGGGVNLTIYGKSDGDRLGFSLAAGDVNGDGFVDLLIGAPGAASPQRGEAGAVYVLLGGHSFGAAPTLDLAQGGSTSLVLYGAGERFGASLITGNAGASDGKADIFIGAPGSSADSAGAAYLFFGDSGLGTSVSVLSLDSTPASVTLRGLAGQRIGTSVAITDINGDGQGDLFAGAPGANRPDRFDGIVPAASAGAVFGVLAPLTTGQQINVGSAEQNLTFYGNSSGERFGASLAAGGITGDEFGDLAIGAPSASMPYEDKTTGIVYTMSANSGSAYVFAGRQGISGRLDVAAREQATTIVFQAEGSLGFSLAIGNYNVSGNADTIADLAIGIPGAGRSQPLRRAGRGGAVVYFGGATLLSVSTRPRSALNPPPAPEQSSLANPDLEYGDNLGFALAFGDLNGDGAGDVVTTAPFAGALGRSQAGLVGIHFGTVVPPVPLSITTDSIPQAKKGTAYAAQFTASGRAPFNWSISTGSLPQGLQLNASTGEVTGTPSVAGTFNFTVTVTDLAGSTASKPMQLAVTDPGPQQPVPRILTAKYKPGKGKVIITGENFTPDSLLRVDGQVVSNAIVDGDGIRAKRVSLLPGNHELRVGNPGGILSDPFTLTVR